MNRKLLPLVFAAILVSAVNAEENYDYQDYEIYGLSVMSLALCSPDKEAKNLLAASMTAARAWANIEAIMRGVEAAEEQTAAFQDGLSRGVRVCHRERLKKVHEFMTSFTKDFNHRTNSWEGKNKRPS